MIGDHKHGADDAIAVINHGDIIKVLPKFPDAVGLQVRMRANYGQIDEITITRIPSPPTPPSFARRRRRSALLISLSWDFRQTRSLM